jgi:hypothetical protein
LTKKRRPIRPHERARVDQLNALTRDMASDPARLTVLSSEYADPGIVCCWCDCPWEDHVRYGSTRCPHCQQEAVYIIRAHHAGQIMVLPVCEPHFEDCLQCWDPEVTWVPVDPVYDADIDDLYAT